MRHGRGVEIASRDALKRGAALTWSAAPKRSAVDEACFEGNTGAVSNTARKVQVTPRGEGYLRARGNDPRPHFFPSDRPGHLQQINYVGAMAHIVDRYRDQITQLAQRAELVRTRKVALDGFKDVTQRNCYKLGVPGNTIVDAEPAHDLLQEMHSDIVAGLASLVTGYSSLRWLFMLRRLPQYVFEGQLVSTIGYDSALADVLSARSTSFEQIRRQDSTFYFHVDGGCVRRLLRFCEGVRTLSHIHVLARWCGKGAKLQIAKDWFPSAETPEELREAVTLYDTRCEVERSTSSAAGTIFHEDSTAPAECILVADRMYPQQLQLPDGNTIEAAFAPRLISLGDVRQQTQNVKLVANTPWPPDSALALWIARAIWFYFVRRHDSLALIRQILNTGYVLIGNEIAEQWISEVGADCKEFVKDAVGHSLNFTSLGDLLTAARKNHGQVWPLLPRDLIRTLPGAVCIDLCAAKNAIRNSLEYTEEQGAAANVRSKHFEAAVQNMSTRRSGGLTAKRESSLASN